MATQTVEFRSPTGQTVVAKLFAVGSDTEVASVTATEATNRKGTYAAAYTDVAATTYDLIALVGGVPVARWQVALTLATATFYAYEPAQVNTMLANTLTASALATDAVTEIQSGLSTLGIADIRTAVGLASANLDTQLADLPTVAEFNARTIASADYATAAALTTVDTWVKRNAVILSGTIATAGTSSEVFTISALGITATIAVDASGNRSSVTWS